MVCLQDLSRVSLNVRDLQFFEIVEVVRLVFQSYFLFTVSLVAK